MASIVLPQVLVFQEFRAVPSELTEPLRAFIFGPEYKLHRYTETSEKVNAGAYAYLTGNTFSWLDDLGRLAGSIVDQSYSKVYVENALLKYWESAAGPHSTSAVYSAPDAVICSTPSGQKNKITVADANLVDKTDYALDATFYDRDVKVGDYAKVRGVVNGVTYNGGGNVIALEAEDVDAVIEAASSASTNAATQGAHAAGTTTVAGDVGITASGTYDGRPDGVLNETYTITVVQGSTGGVPSTMVIDITSASGKDDVIGYQPVTSIWTTTIPLGNNGLYFKMNQSTGADVEADWSWTVEVSQAFTAPTATSNTAGAYTGATDTTYVVTVTRGGDSVASDDADKPLVSITTTTGVDGSSPKVISGAAASNTITVGNKGVTLVWNQRYFCAGDRYYVPVTAAGAGAIRTVVIDRSLPDELVSTDTETIDLTLSLHIKKSELLPQQLFNEGVVNWSQDADGITINDNAKDYDSSWRDGEVALPIIAADIYVHWRELITTHSDQVYSIGTLGDLSDEFTTKNTPDNPLVYACAKALANSGTEAFPSSGIRVMAVPSNDLEGYQAVLDAAEVRDDLYTFVPLTFDRTIQDLVAAHVTTMSTPETGLWRIAFVCSEEVNPAPEVQLNTDDSVVLATTDDNGYLDLDDSADVEFLTAGVLAGDKVRTNFSSDQYGVTTYDEYVIDNVLAENRLKLVTYPDPAITVASKIEVWRALNSTGIVTQIATKAGSFASRRVYNVYPSTIASGGVNVPGYFLCAAIAGIIGSVAPQQGLTNLQIKGFDNANQVVNRFTRSNLDNMTDGGVWIVTHDLKTGQVYTRHQLSTDVTDLNTRELNVVKNLDSISYFFLNRLKPFIGRANVSPTSIEVIRGYVQGGITFLGSSVFNELIGGQVLEGTAIRALRAHEILKDRIVIVLDLVLPYPLNNIELHLVV